MSISACQLDSSKPQEREETQRRDDEVVVVRTAKGKEKGDRSTGHQRGFILLILYVSGGSVARGTSTLVQPRHSHLDTREMRRCSSPRAA